MKCPLARHLPPQLLPTADTVAGGMSPENIFHFYMNESMGWFMTIFCACVFHFREQQNETFSKRFKQEENRDDETPAGQQCHPSAIRQKETRKGNTQCDACCALYVCVSIIYFTSIIWICSSNQNFNLYSESFTALAFKAHRLRKKEAVDCGDSKVQTQKPTGPRFTSSLYFRLSRNLGLDNPELRIKKNLDRRLHR